MKIVIVTDAWKPQVNGVVTTLTTLAGKLEQRGHQVFVLEPGQFFSMKCPVYPEIRLAVGPLSRLRVLLDNISADAIHIATEGPLGWAARDYCLKKGLSFTTAFHTRFPEYLEAQLGLPPAPIYSVLRSFHRPASTTMCTTPSMLTALKKEGFSDLKLWTRGVDTDQFFPSKPKASGAPPLLTYVGRVSKEKNIEAFLNLRIAGRKKVVGSGPHLEALRLKFPEVEFTGPLFGKDLRDAYSEADCFVFPSRTDTFGLVMLEALACGTPVAAFPVEGPKDVITDPRVGALDVDLKVAIERALLLSPHHCRAHALKFSWDQCVDQFLSNLSVLNRPAVSAEPLMPFPAFALS